MNNKSASVILATWFCLILLSSISPLPAAGKADFVIIKNPAALTILNRFQQRLTKSDARNFGAQAPFKVLQLDETLGDELTRAHRVSFKGKIYFLVLDDKGRPTGLPPDEELKVLKNCQVLGDTIRVRQSGRLTFRPGSLGRGDLLLRQFKNRGAYYLSSLGRKPLSGWCSLQPASAWEKVVVREKPKKAVLNASLQERIRERFKKVNQAYQHYFDHFNQQTGENRSAPRWKCTGSAFGFTCTFSGSAQDVKDLAKSTQILVDGLQHMLLGKPFRVSLEHKRIFIKPQP
jgi:hypothetical protein